MKKVIIAIASLMVAVASYAQGTLVFNNRIPGVVDARVTFGGAGVGAGFTAELLGGPVGGTLQPLTPTATFRTSPAAALGYINAPASAVVVPGVPAGGTAQIVMRAFNGATYESSSIRGQSTPITVGPLGGTPPGGAPLTPPNLVNLQAFELVPEPSTIALGVLGLAGALLLRRRK